MRRRFGFAIFDLDGTLHDSAGCVAEATRVAFGAHGLAAPAAHEVRRWLGVPVERSFDLMAAAADRGRDWSPVIATFRARYAELAPTRVRPFPGVVELLGVLRGAGVRSVVVTSKKRSVAERDCAATGTAAFLDGVVGSDCVARPKPDAEPVHHARARFAIPALADALVIGDAAVDIQMGRSAGAATCAALWGAHSADQLLAAHPAFVARSPADLRGLFGVAET